MKKIFVPVLNHAGALLARAFEANLLKELKVVKGDIIAIGTHLRKGIAFLIYGSLADDVANHAKIFLILPIVSLVRF